MTCWKNVIENDLISEHCVIYYGGLCTAARVDHLHCVKCSWALCSLSYSSSFNVSLYDVYEKQLRFKNGLLGVAVAVFCRAAS